MAGKKVSRRQAIKVATAGVGGIAATSMLGESAEAKGRKSQIEVTINLDSGIFLPRQEANPNHAEIGYYQGMEGIHDIIVFVDGEEVDGVEGFQAGGGAPFKLGGENCTVEVRHINVDGSIRAEGVTSSRKFHKYIAHMKDLYGEHIEVDRGKFDSVLRFTSGHFLPSMVKVRAFKEVRREPDGTMTITGNRKTLGPISHNVLIQFKLARGEELELARNGTVFFSTRSLGAKERVEIEVAADNTTGQKFYSAWFMQERDVYWLPNECDPPPNCPRPPCGGG